MNSVSFFPVDDTNVPCSVTQASPHLLPDFYRGYIVWSLFSLKDCEFGIYFKMHTPPHWYRATDWTSLQFVCGMVVLLCYRGVFTAEECKTLPEHSMSCPVVHFRVPVGNTVSTIKLFSPETLSVNSQSFLSLKKISVFQLKNTIWHVLFSYIQYLNLFSYLLGFHIMRINRYRPMIFTLIKSISFVLFSRENIRYLAQPLRHLLSNRILSLFLQSSSICVYL